MAGVGETKESSRWLRDLLLAHLEASIKLDAPLESKLKSTMKLVGFDPDVLGWQEALRMVFADDASKKL